MREIKLRAWEKNLKAMISVDSIDFKARLINMESAWRMFEEIELMQYTGLKDKNGVEIYEGDIVQPSNRAKDRFVIVWKDSGFQRKYTFIRKYDGEEWEETTHLPIYPSGHVVIGNIYENPELLEESAE